MKVRATCWIKHDGNLYRAGEVFDLPAHDVQALGDSVETMETDTAEPIQDESTEKNPAATEEKPKRGRRAKA